MARPSLPWNDLIKPAYEGGKTVDQIVKEFSHLGLKKKTLQNKISAEKWEILGKAGEAIKGAIEVSGKLRELRESNPKTAKHVADRIEELTDFNVLLEDTLMSGMRVQKEIFDDRCVTTQVSTQNGIEELSRSLTPKDVNDGMNALYRAKEIKFGKEFPRNGNEVPQGEIIEVEGYELERPDG